MRRSFFSGIAMTSERILLGNHPIVGSSVAMGFNGKRTSDSRHINIKKAYQEKGYNEPTATIVWGSILEHCKSPLEIVL